MLLRNQVREFMTGSQEEISWEQQCEWFKNLDRENIHIWVFYHGGYPAGYGQIRIDDLVGVSTHAVDESFRGQGFGEYILRFLISQAEDMGLRAMSAEIFKSNAPSLGLCYKLGYIDTRDLGDTQEVFKWL
jgi:L-amino acid N-acyltransferase YncA